MTKTRTTIQPRELYSRTLNDGTLLQAEVSPCVFMYKGYPLQVTVTFVQRDGQPGGDAHAVDRQLTAATATEADVMRLMAAVGTVACKRCSAVAFDPATVETNRDGLCERCFLDDLNASVNDALEEERRELEKQDDRMKRKGMRFRVTAWIHSDDADDCQVDWYFNVQPTKTRIRGLLREEGSEILDDFQIVAL